MAQLDTRLPSDRNFALVVPTLNASRHWPEWLKSFNSQHLKPQRTLIIDSASDDCTVNLAKSAGLEVIQIKRGEFNHGATRQQAAELLGDCPIIIYMTQDAILADPDTFAELISRFEDPHVGAAYGRQLPHRNARPIEQHARLFNYPANSHIVDQDNFTSFGIKAAFLSNSFCGYRVSALQEAGGFPTNTIVSEDMFVGAKMLEKNWKLSYAAKATVRHSHSYNYRQELGRYFDIGVFFSREGWIKERFGGAGGEGLRFIMSETKFLLRHAPWLLVSAGLRTFIKYAGFKLGLNEKQLPLKFKRRLSTQSYYWDQNSNV